MTLELVNPDGQWQLYKASQLLGVDCIYKPIKTDVRQQIIYWIYIQLQAILWKHYQNEALIYSISKTYLMLQWVKVFSFWLYNKEGAAQPHYMTEDNATTSWACVQSPIRLWLLAKDLQVETPVTNESNTPLLIWAK